MDELNQPVNLLQPQQTQTSWPWFRYAIIIGIIYLIYTNRYKILQHIKSLIPPQPNPTPNPPTQPSSLNDTLNKLKPEKKQEKKQELKSGYCYIGKSADKTRACIRVTENDTCMSGDIFPTKDLCINPNIRMDHKS